MSEFGQMWRLISKEQYDAAKEKERANDPSEKLRENLKAAFWAGYEYASDDAGHSGYEPAPDFNEWYKGRFS